MFHYSRTTLRELRKRYSNILKKCFLMNLGLLLCTTTAFAESAYIMKETGVGGLLVPEYDSNTNTLVDKYYEVDLKNKSYGNDDVSRTYQVEILGKEIDIVANYDPAKSNPRYHSPDGDISGTWIDISTKDELGGAYSNWYGGTITLTGDFINNIIKNGSSTARGGAYGNVYGWEVSSMEGNYIANGALSDGVAQGGAIYSQENLGAPKAMFIGNWAKGGTRANGGALVNYGGYSDPVHSHFIGNYAESVSGEAGGGAVFLYGHDINIEGDFLGNYALSETGHAIGGGVYLKYRSGYWSENFSLKGDFIDNRAISKESIAAGGAVYNGEGISMDFVQGMFLDNYLEAKESAGGAIYNASIIKEIKGKFIGNKSQGVDSAQGGAIYNADTGNLVIQDSQFFYNKALSEEGTALGGAIHNEGQITFKGHNIFAENKVNNALNDIHNEGDIFVEGTLVTSSGLTGNGTVTVKKDGVFDIQTSKNQIGNLTVEEGGTLKVSLKSLQDHGKVIGAVEGIGKLDLKMGMNVESGQYQIFDQDTNLELSDNKLFNIQDMNNGRYDISKKTVSELSSALNIKENEAKALSAVVDKPTTHQEFAKIQEEIFTVLSSDKGGSSEKVKKALSAIGTSEQAAASLFPRGMQVLLVKLLVVR